ncbi:PEP-CTERM sorting domain-containing protein [Planctomycetota bacterium]
MKKIISLLMILSLATVANASLFEISVNGEIAGDEITIAPSDYIDLDVYFGGVQYMGGDLVLQLSNAQAELIPQDFTHITPVPTDVAPGPGEYIMDVAWEGPWQLIDATKDWALFSGGNVTNNTMGPYTLLDNIVLHCLEATDVILELVAFSDQVYLDDTTEEMTMIPGHGQGTILDRLTIHQIPEPATIALLGLGGLFLRRRRK